MSISYSNSPSSGSYEWHTHTGTTTANAAFTINDSNGYTYIDNIHDDHIHNPSFGNWDNVVIDKSKYDILEKITLDLIRGGFGCNIERARELLKLEMEGKLFIDDKPKPKEWIDPKLFKI